MDFSEVLNETKRSIPENIKLEYQKKIINNPCSSSKNKFLIVGSKVLSLALIVLFFPLLFLMQVDYDLERVCKECGEG